MLHCHLMMRCQRLKLLFNKKLSDKQKSALEKARNTENTLKDDKFTTKSIITKTRILKNEGDFDSKEIEMLMLNGLCCKIDSTDKINIQAAILIEKAKQNNIATASGHVNVTTITSLPQPSPTPVATPTVPPIIPPPPTAPVTPTSTSATATHLTTPVSPITTPAPVANPTVPPIIPPPPTAPATPAMTNEQKADEIITDLFAKSKFEKAFYTG